MPEGLPVCRRTFGGWFPSCFFCSAMFWPQQSIYRSSGILLRSAPLSARTYVSQSERAFRQFRWHLNLNDIVGVCTDQRFTYRAHWRSFHLKAVSLYGTDLPAPCLPQTHLIIDANLAAYADSVKIDFVSTTTSALPRILPISSMRALDISLLIAPSYSTFSRKISCSLASLILPYLTSFLLTSFQVIKLVFQFFLKSAYVSKFLLCFFGTCLPSKPRCFSEKMQPDISVATIPKALFLKRGVKNLKDIHRSCIMPKPQYCQAFHQKRI